MFAPMTEMVESLRPKTNRYGMRTIRRSPGTRSSRRMSKRREPAGEARRADHATLVVDVVANLRRQGRVAGHREEQLSLPVGLDVVEQWVVLEDHGAAPGLAEEGLSDLRAVGGQPPESDADRRLRRQPDLDVRRSVAREHAPEAAEEVVAQRLRVAFPPSSACIS